MRASLYARSRSPRLERLERLAEEHARLVDLLLPALERHRGGRRGGGHGEERGKGEQGDEDAAHRLRSGRSAALIRQT